MKQACFLLNLALAAGLFTVSANGATITWASGASGNWSNPTNWNPNQVPGSSDTAVITASGNYTVTVDTTVTVNGLVLGSDDATVQTVLINGESLAIGQLATVNTNGVINMSSGELNFASYGGSIVNGALTCSGGTIGGVLTIASNGVANLIGISAGTQTIDFASLTLTNLGTIVWSNLNIECQSSSAIDNYGLWDIQTNNIYNGASSADSTVFNNYGTLRKDGGAWTVYQLSPLAVFDSTVNLNNSGTVDVETGGLSISTGSGSGLFNTATSAGLLLGNFTLTGNPAFTGAGQVQGNLYGYNTAIYGSLNFSAGTLAGALTVASNSVINLYWTGSTLPIGLEGLILTNYGTVIWGHFDLDCESGAQIYNYGLWDAQSDNTFYGNSGGGPFMSTFNNYGTVRKDGGSGITTFDSATTFNNSGTVDVETAQINIDMGSGGGLFNAATNTIVWLGIPDTFNLTSSATFTGPGSVGGNLYGYGNGVIHGSLNFYYGSLGGVLTIASNAVANLTDILEGTQVVSQAVVFTSITLTNYGTVAWNDVDLKCSSSQIYNYGLWDAWSDNTFYGDYLAPFISTFNNYGTVRKDGGSGITTFDSATTFNNSGTVDVETAQINIDMGSGGGLFNAATNTIVWLGIPDTFNLTSSATFTGPGSVGGNLYGYGNGVIHGSLNFYYGSLGGTLTVASNAVANLTDVLVGTQIVAQAVVFNSLTLTNYGTVAWNNVDLQCSSTLVCNYGLWDAQSDNKFYGDFLAPFISTFNNYGTVRKDGGSGITTFDSATTFNNSGTVDVTTAQININMGSGGGLFNTASNAILWLGIPNSFNLNGNTTFTGPGLVGGNLYGYTNGVIRGSFNFYYGSLSGSVIVASNAVANLIGAVEPTQPIILNGLTLTNCGTVVWSNIDLDGTSTLVCNHGLWDALSDNTFYGDVLAPFISTFNNYGTVRKDGGSATTTYDSATTFNNYGKTDVQIGQVIVEGSCSLTNGTLNFGIWGPSQFGAIDFPNTVQLAGRLGANLRNHYTPAAGNSFPVVVYGLGTETFTSLCLPTLSSGLIWQTNYTSTAFTVSVVAAPPLQLSAGLSVSGNSMTLSWNGLLGQTYQVQCATNLAPANWVNLGDPITGTNGPVSVLDSINANPQKYYRIQSQ